jgi:hypothetical protein
MSQIIFSSLVCGCLMHSLEGSWTSESTRKSRKSDAARSLPAVQANRINIRQIEGGGIGYGQGYTTLETFLTPFKTFDSWLPFVDIRGHRFDNNKYALNAGLGVRYFIPSACTIWGLNAYYDYRETGHKNYKQVGIGLEALGAHWDCRFNGYIPVSSRKSGFYQVKLDKFVGHNAYVKAKREFDMGGVNVEAAYHWMPKDYIDVTAALGPYYFRGEFSQFAAGGQARLKATFLDAISIEGITSYDNLFKWKGQGQLTFSIPLGPTKLKTRGIGQSNCNNKSALDLRVVQPVQRFEIIVADSHKSSGLAIDPATGQPYNFIFVNNDPSMTPDGSFENPFLDLTTAQNASAPGDIVYVYGSGVTYTPAVAGNSVFIMQNNQRLWGSGIKHHLKTSVGGMNIPAMTAAYPALDNPVTGTQAMNSIVALANNTEVSGFSFPNANVLFSTSPVLAAITGQGITNATVKNNRFNLAGNMGTTGIGFLDCSGTMKIQNNTMTVSNMMGNFVVLISNDSGLTAPCTYEILSNTIIGNGMTTGVYCFESAMITAPRVLLIQDNLFNQCNYGTYAAAQSPSFNMALIDNTFLDASAYGSVLFGEAGAGIVGQIDGNSYQGNTEFISIFILAQTGSTACLQINYNALDVPSSIGTPPGGTVYLETPVGNTGPLQIDPSVIIVPPGTCE